MQFKMRMIKLEADKKHVISEVESGGKIVSSGKGSGQQDNQQKDLLTLPVKDAGLFERQNMEAVRKATEDFLADDIKMLEGSLEGMFSKGEASNKERALAIQNAPTSGHKK